MLTHNNLWDKICSFQNLLSAAEKAQKGKRFQDNVGRFNFNLEAELLLLQNELQNQAYQPGLYRSFYIYEPKKRMISAAPYRDRVVHHALCNIIEPIFDKIFISDSYANRKGKGTHKAVNRFSEFCKKNKYVLKCDIKKYFPSIDHQILYNLLAKRITDQKCLWFIKLIIDSSNPQEEVIRYFDSDNLFTPCERRRGLPIGNLTSQFFANIYLNEFDHFVKEQLKCRYYIRYVDDFVVLDDDKDRLHKVKNNIERYLEVLRLRLHPRKCHIFPVTQGTNFLGYRIFPTHRLLNKDNIRRFKKRLSRFQQFYAAGMLALDKLTASIRSWIAHASHADTYGLRQWLLGAIKFIRQESNKDVKSISQEG